jgi:hypothetical protein
MVELPDLSFQETMYIHKEVLRWHRLGLPRHFELRPQSIFCLLDNLPTSVTANRVKIFVCAREVFQHPAKGALNMPSGS